MAKSNPETIQIKDESIAKEKRYQLYIDGCRRGCITKKHGVVKLHWPVAGPIQWSESRVILQGLLELSTFAAELEDK